MVLVLNYVCTSEMLLPVSNVICKIHIHSITYMCMYTNASYSVWSPRNCIPVVDLLDEWIALFSDWIVTNILDQLIIPKLHVRPCIYIHS